VALDLGEVETFRRARELVTDRIAAAALRAGRDPREVTLVAVSKTVPVERIRAAVAAGLTVLGENRVQEGQHKIPEVPGAHWHLLGPLQANKARRAVELFDVLEAVGSLELAQRLDRIAGEVRPRRPLPVLLQVNVAGDPAKSGFDEASIAAALPALAVLPSIRLDGLMTIGRLVASAEAARPTFRALRLLSARLRAAEPRLGPGLSMGMSGDYEVAVEEGATIVRVGRALFGERPVPTGQAAEG